MKQRRALTTVIGGVFFLIVIMTAASYLTYSMNLFENFSENVFAVEQEKENRKKESFEISKLLITNNKIDLDIHNSGDIPISFTRLWIENVTGVDQVYKFDLENSVHPGSTAEDILQGLSFTALQTQTYKMKLVTERGTAKEVSINASNVPLHLQLFTLPEEVPTGFVSTILLSVTNNSTENIIYTNIQPEIIEVSPEASAVLEGTTPTAHPVLEKGETVIFEWRYRISGNDGDQVQFTARIQNGVPGNSVTKTVEVQKIELADVSENALHAGILAQGVLTKNVLVFHKENLDAMSERQMWSSTPEDDIGEIINLNFTNPKFLTNADGNVTVNIPAGQYTAALRYISSPMPDSLMTLAANEREDMAYHFESDLNSPLDTTGNTIMTLGLGFSRPVWDSTGHQGAGAYVFSGSQFAVIGVNDNNDLDGDPATTAGWFKADSSAVEAVRQTIYFGETTNEAKSYAIFLNNEGHLVFQTDTGTTLTPCISTVDYRDDSWHHFAAVTPGSNDCILYVDGIAQSSLIQSGNDNIILQGNIFVGASDAVGTDGFNGMIDDLIHWDGYDLNNNYVYEVQDLFNTNYGVGSHVLDFDIRIVGNSFVIGPADKTITQTINVPVKYSSDFGNYDSPLGNDIWGLFNFTALAGEKVIAPDERLMLNMTFSHKTFGNLGMKMIIDDVDVTGVGSSFLETPDPDIEYPGYAIYDNSSTGSINIFNSSPNHVWIKYQSRVVFEDEITGVSYASFVDNSGSSSIGPTQDSPSINSGSSSTLQYGKPRLQPGNTSSDLIPEGRYRMYIFLDGYDSTGTVFLETSTIGIVRVI